MVRQPTTLKTAIYRDDHGNPHRQFRIDRIAPNRGFGIVDTRNSAWIVGERGMLEFQTREQAEQYAAETVC